MGYKNGYRPRRLQDKLVEVLVDLTDLAEYSKPEYLEMSREELSKNIEFVRETLGQYAAGIARKNRRKKEQ